MSGSRSPSELIEMVSSSCPGYSDIMATVSLYLPLFSLWRDNNKFMRVPIEHTNFVEELDWQPNLPYLFSIELETFLISTNSEHNTRNQK